MKRIFIFLLLALFLLGCSNGDDTSGPVNSEGKKEQENNGFGFIYKDTSIKMYDEAAPILDKLGKEVDYFEAESCAFQGMDKIYTYGAFELHTHEIEGVDHVSSIIFLDDSISTKEGVSLFSSFDDMMEVYGKEDYTEEHGLYTFEKGDSMLLLLIEDEEIVSIEYMAKVEN